MKVRRYRSGYQAILKEKDYREKLPADEIMFSHKVIRFSELDLFM